MAKEGSIERGTKTARRSRWELLSQERRVSRRVANLAPEAYYPIDDADFVIDCMVEMPRNAGNHYGRSRPYEKTNKMAAIDENNTPLSPVAGVAASQRIVEFGTPSPKSGGYRSVFNESGTKLNRVAMHRTTTLYEEGYEAVSRPKNAGVLVKKESKVITLSYKNIESFRAKKRKDSQNKVAGASANVTAFEAEQKAYDGEKWEWLHLIAFRFLGQEAQKLDNLVAGTKHANTAMLVLAEQHIEELSLINGSLDLQVTAMVDPENNIADSIEYKIMIKGKPNIILDFNAREIRVPSKLDGDYSIKAIKKKLSLEDSESSTDASQNTQSETEDTPPAVGFFTRMVEAGRWAIAGVGSAMDIY
ncbi:MAG: hypothetical protein K0R98_469 [Rickettsiaceae bacterium]|nr:hypothetical protein [Rickettsiaceae bacterium]